MGVISDKIQELKQKEQQIMEMGGKKALEKRREKGKLNARERLDILFDKGTFRELDMFVTHRCTNFGMESIEIPADGVVTGHGKVDGRIVFAYAQDFTARAGSLGEMQAKKMIISAIFTISCTEYQIAPVDGYWVVLFKDIDKFSLII